MKNELLVKGKNVLVLGYAVTGRSVVDFLLVHQAQVTLNDQADLINDPTVQTFIQQGVDVIGLGHPLNILGKKFDYIVKNPGIPYTLPLLKEAQKQGIPIYTDIELFNWHNKSHLIAITGSNGKTTTASLAGEIFKQSDYQSYLVGNIGIPTLSILEDEKNEDVVVMEVSSFQLMGTEKFKPYIACITNIGEAHTDYHGSREAYIEAKLRLLANQDEHDYVVYNADSVELTNLIAPYSAQKVPFAREHVTEEVKAMGAYVERTGLYFKGEHIINIADIQIPGVHNIENTLAAIAMAKLMNVPNEQIQLAVRTFNGVPYCIQPIGVYQGVEFYNDSKSTNNQATITALNSFKKPIVYIGGGKDRKISFDELIPHSQNVRVAIVYGEAKEAMANMFERAKVAVVEQVETLEQATNRALELAQSGDVVLLSPCCASWDQFKNYEERGALFTKIVTESIQS